LEAGLSGEFVNVDYSDLELRIRRHRVSPKLGLSWAPLVGTTIRLAAFSSVKRTLIGSQTIEPTQVAGFNQFFAGFNALYGDSDGTVSQRFCAAVDQKISPTAFAGAEFTARKLKVPSTLDTDYDWRERTARAYLYKAYKPALGSMLSGWQMAASIDLRFEEIDHSESFTGPDGILNVRTDRVPIGIRVFSDGGLAIGAVTSYVRQGGLFFDGTGGDPEVARLQRGWINDVFVDYRLPRRLGVLSVGAKNLFNRAIDLFETDPAFPTLPAQRFLYLRARFVL
jgi:hypothetical protein